MSKYNSIFILDFAMWIFEIYNTIAIMIFSEIERKFLFIFTMGYSQWKLFHSEISIIIMHKYQIKNVQLSQIGSIQILCQ